MFFYTFMPRLFNMSLTASVAIVLVILLRLLLKKAPKVISYALWGVVLFRLLCPVSIESSLSLYNLFDAPAEESGTMTSIILCKITFLLNTVLMHLRIRLQKKKLNVVRRKRRVWNLSKPKNF